MEIVPLSIFGVEVSYADPRFDEESVLVVAQWSGPGDRQGCDVSLTYGESGHQLISFSRQDVHALVLCLEAMEKRWRQEA